MLYRRLSFLRIFILIIPGILLVCAGLYMQNESFLRDKQQVYELISKVKSGAITSEKEIGEEFHISIFSPGNKAILYGKLNATSFAYNGNLSNEVRWAGKVYPDELLYLPEFWLPFLGMLYLFVITLIILWTEVNYR